MAVIIKNAHFGPRGVYIGPTDSWLSTRIVTSGLVLHLDAGNTESYPGTGTIWTDLSGNGRNGTLNNMDGTNFNSANGGSLYFDQTNEYVQVSGSITVTAATFLAFIKKDNVQLTNYNGLIFSRGVNVSGMNFRDSNAANQRSALAYHWNGSETGFDTLRLLDTNDPWRMAAITFTSTVATGYLTSTTGVLQSQTINGTFNSSNLSNIQVGGDASLSRYYKGNIAVAMVYNRALTASEITRNFNALRGRFGI